MEILIPEKFHGKFAKGFGLLKRLKPEEVGRTLETFALRKNGEKFPIELSYYVWGTNELFFTAIVRDVSERKRLERQLVESEEMFRKLAEKSLVGIYLIQDGVFKYVNPKLAELWGYSVSELIGRSPLEFIHPEDRERVRRNIERRIEGEIESIHYKFRTVRKGGEVRHNEVFGSRIIYERRPAVIGTLIDVTDEERLAQKLEEYERFYLNAQDLFFILDRKGRFVDVNLKYAEMLGYKKEELVGRTARKLTSPEELEMVRENFERVMEGKSVRYKAKAIAKSGKVYVMDVVVWPIFEDRKVIGAEGIVRDVTSLVRLNRLLNATNNISKLIVREKDEMKLIRKAAEELSKLGYFSCWIGLKDEDLILTTSEVIRELKLDGRNANCVIQALNNKEIILRENSRECESCEFF